MSFERCTLADIAAPIRNAIVGGPFGSNLVSKDYTPSGVPVIRGQNMGDKWVSGDFAFVSNEKAAQLSQNLARPNDLVFTQRGTLGQVSIVPRAPYDTYVVSQSQMKITVDPVKADVSFLYYLFKTPEQLQYIFNSAIQTGVPHTNLGILKKTPLNLPPLSVQKSIAEIVGALDDRITLLRETNATLEAIAQALFKSWFVDFDPVHAKSQGLAPAGMDEATAALFADGFEESAFGLVPKGWQVHRLGDVVRRITKGTTPTTLKRPFVEAGINFVKAESMTDDGGFIPEKFAFIDRETHELLRRSQLEAGDVLISIAGTIGRVAVMTEDFLPANTNQAIALIRPLQGRFPSGLISRFLQRDESRQLMGERVVQAVQANLSLGSLSDLKIALPSPELTRQLYQTGMEQVDASKALNHRKIRTLATLRDTLLPRLISGQLRLPEAEAAMEAALA